MRPEKRHRWIVWQLKRMLKRSTAFQAVRFLAFYLAQEPEV